MALFSRRPAPNAASESTDVAAPAPTGEIAAASAVGTAAGNTTDGTASGEGDITAAAAAASIADAVPEVSISISTFGGPGAAPAAVPAPAPFTLPSPEMPAVTEAVPGMPDNVLLKAALAALVADAPAPQLMNVARQLLQGHLYLRVKGDARALVDAGKELPLSIATRGDERFALVFSGGEALRDAVNADGDTDTSAVSKPAIEVLNEVLTDDFAGIAIDHASTPHSAILPRQLLERALVDLDPELAVKTLLLGARDAATPAAVAGVLVSAPLWLAARTTESGDMGIAEVHTEDGTRYIEVFSHPLELIALGRGDEPVQITGPQLGAALRSDDGITGVIVDPAGPWISLTRTDLAAVLALDAP
ncbi:MULTISPECIES: SseB family protein [Microbacterium]|uniref:SseB protein N-terminal domain-containing protein n=1 Tax=Microbacterium ginsengisoli TaxID=400772 RepID=A0A0F0LX81_9MICO|nr:MULTISPECIES: SseB family protein [Microbacterium]KJL38851.1 hypothetical protein RR49_00652 [Microbacterium ginsengisoli]MCK9916634.1 SseB family protein [Microbacteriaceae bacterium K1510]